MICYRIDLRDILRVTLLGKEKLIPPRMHYTRKTVEYIMYVVLDGTLNLKVDGEKITGSMPAVDQATPSISVDANGLVTATATHFVLRKYKDKGVIYGAEEIDERGNCN